MATIISLILFFFALPFMLGQSTVIYSSGAYSLQLVDKSNGQLSSSTIQNQVNIFFQSYPGMAANYNNAPTTVTITLDPSVAQNTIAVSSTGISLSVANLQANGDDTGYMQFGLNYMLSNFYTTGPTTTSAPTTQATATGISGMTDALRQSVLSIHNNYRSSLAEGNVQSAGGQMPQAANMNQLIYSIAQENAAANWAAQCIDEHTPNNPYGQNKCTSSGQSDFSEFISGCSTLWWNEVEQWPNTSNTTLTDANWEPVGHWSQMAWATAKQVGCAVKYCSSVGTLLFCNYDTGNIIDYPIYNTGITCSGCTTSCTSNGLCQ